MRRQKAAKPATATTVNGLHTNKVSAGQRKLRDASKTFDPSAQPGFLSVYDGREFLGHLLPQGAGIEAFSTAGELLGIFRNQKIAADAVTQASRGTT